MSGDSWLRRPRVVLVVVGAAAAMGIAAYAVLRPDVDLWSLRQLQLAGSADAARVAMESASPADWRREISADFAFIVGYGGLLWLVCRLGQWLFVTRRAKAVAQGGMGAALAAMVADGIENVNLLRGITDKGVVDDDRVFEWVQGAAVAKWTAIVIAGVIAAVSIGVLVKWFVVHIWRCWRCQPRQAGADDFFSPPPVLKPQGPWPTKRPPERQGRGTRWAYARMPLPQRPPGGVGICASGGGVRSASVTLGALDSLREEVAAADYLVSVSGGGYATGAVRLALQRFKDGTAGAATPQDVFGPGSVELDHVRRNGHYIADGVTEWLVALGVILRGVVVSLALLAAVVCTLGLAVNALHQAIPFFDLPLGLPRGRFFERGWSDPRLVVVFAAAALAIVVWLFSFLFQVPNARRWTALARGLATLAGAFSLFLVIVPGLAHLALLVAGDTVDLTRGPLVALATVFGTYGGALVAVLWRQKDKGAKLFGAFRKKGESSELTRAVPNGLLQYAIVWLVLLALAAMGLFLFAWSAATSRDWDPWVKIALPATLIVLGAGLDHTRLSLHPFYRRRLARAFSVRRRNLSSDEVVPAPYEFDSEETDLETYAAPMTGRNRFPRVIFAAAANLSGADRTPPRRRAVSYAFASDYIGGPDIGYVRTSVMRSAVPRWLHQDLTVQTAVAVSGAAFASAMGRQARAFQVLLAISNARLGTWLPNPAYLAETQKLTWNVPGVPARRRLTYQLKEIFGMFADDDPLLLVTDGGHYENLGLVELLRHGPETVYCIDGSGDAPPFATTLAQAVVLAYEELGVEIELDPNMLGMVPGSAEPLEPAEPLKSLSARLSKHAVATGRIIYPPDRPEGVPPEGRLVVAKAGLTPDMPYDLLSYALSNPAFPRDSTGDQWFDHEQFHAYHALGRYLGKEAKAVLKQRWPPEDTNPPLS